MIKLEGIELKPGQVVKYRGVEYFVISTLGYELAEIAPTRHGAGSFMAHVDYLKLI